MWGLARLALRLPWVLGAVCVCLYGASLVCLAASAASSDAQFLVMGLEVSPTLFDPSAEPIEPVVVSFTLSQSARVWLIIESGDGTSLRRLLGGVWQDEGDHVFAWDGKDALGRVVPQGDYVLVLRAQTLAGLSDERRVPIRVRQRPSLEVEGCKTFDLVVVSGEGDEAGIREAFGHAPGTYLDQRLTFSVHGTVPPHLSLKGTYDDGAYPAIRELLVSYQSPRLTAHLGEFNYSVPGFEFAVEQKRVVGLDGALKGEVGARGSGGTRTGGGATWLVGAVAAEIATCFAHETVQGTDSVELYLSHAPIVPGSERLSRDGGVLERDRDYIIDYASGRVVLAYPLEEGEELEADYEYYPEGAAGRQQLYGASAELELGHAGSARELSLDLGAYAHQLTEQGETVGRTLVEGAAVRASLGEAARVCGEVAFSDYDPASLSDEPSQATAYYASGELAVLGKAKIQASYKDVPLDFRPIVRGSLQSGTTRTTVGTEIELGDWVAISGSWEQFLYPAPGGPGGSAAGSSAGPAGSASSARPAETDRWARQITQATLELDPPGPVSLTLGATHTLDHEREVNLARLVATTSGPGWSASADYRSETQDRSGALSRTEAVGARASWQVGDRLSARAQASYQRAVALPEATMTRERISATVDATYRSPAWLLSERTVWFEATDFGDLERSSWLEFDFEAERGMRGGRELTLAASARASARTDVATGEVLGADSYATLDGRVGWPSGAYIGLAYQNRPDSDACSAARDGGAARSSAGSLTHPETSVTLYARLVPDRRTEALVSVWAGVEEKAAGVGLKVSRGLRQGLTVRGVVDYRDFASADTSASEMLLAASADWVLSDRFALTGNLGWALRDDRSDPDESYSGTMVGLCFSIRL